MPIKTAAATCLFALATAGCQNTSQTDRVPGEPYARPADSEPTVKVISVERLGDAPEHPSTEVQAQARRFGTATRRRAQTSRFDVPARDAARSEPSGTPDWPPAPESDDETDVEVEGEGEGAGAARANRSRSDSWR